MPAKMKPKPKAKPKPSRNGVAHEPEVMTLAEAAALLRVTPQELEFEVQRGAIPGRSISGHWRFSAQAIQTWLAIRTALPWEHFPVWNAETEKEAEAEIAELRKRRKSNGIVGDHPKRIAG